jgi:hypothetical protein
MAHFKQILPQLTFSQFSMMPGQHKALIKRQPIGVFAVKLLDSAPTNN